VSARTLRCRMSVVSSRLPTSCDCVRLDSKVRGWVGVVPFKWSEAIHMLTIQGIKVATRKSYYSSHHHFKVCERRILAWLRYTENFQLVHIRDS